MLKCVASARSYPQEGSCCLWLCLQRGSKRFAECLLYYYKIWLFSGLINLTFVLKSGSANKACTALLDIVHLFKICSKLCISLYIIHTELFSIFKQR